MGTRDDRVDAYIAQAAEFARPILTHLRALVHAACPGVNETIKWGFPHFEYKGVLCSMASFKAHCAFGFWHSEMRAITEGLASETAMGQFGRITRSKDLPSDAVLTKLIIKATALNAAGAKPARAARTEPKGPLAIPDDLATALCQHRSAQANFEAMSPSHRREYIEWLLDAKRPATRAKRLATALAWISEGKSKEWKYR
jgi:uncharacterized protein YdeI (YjbR/CyaY-like superfamily)